MLNQVIDLSLRHRGIVLIATALLAIAGTLSFVRLPFDAFPDTTPVQVAVNTSAPSLSPLEVERQITFPLEQAIGGLVGLKEARSVSKFGFSQITAIFNDDIDIYLARQIVMERIQTAELPPSVERPSLGPVSTGLGEIFQYVVKSQHLTPTQLRTLHHWVIRPQMVNIEGVAEINTWGGYEKQYHVVIDPERLIKHDLTLDDVARALKDNNANAGGGYIEVGGEARIIQGLGLASTLFEIESIVIAAHSGVPIFVRDVARVEEGHEVRRGAVTADGSGEVVLGLGFMLMGENSRKLTKLLEARLSEIAQGLPEGVELVPVYSRTELVDRVLNTVRANLLEGALLVIAVLFIFLGHIRAGLIVATAIPLSMLFAFNAMLQLGIAGSLMSLGAIDFGMVVDSSVIMVENATRHLQKDRSNRSVIDIVREAAVEVRRPTLFGELIIAIVYLPILFLEGVEGKMFRPMALTVIFALLGSMIFSLTLMPVLASLTLRRDPKGSEDNRIVCTLKRMYRPVLAFALARRGVVLSVTALLGANAIFVATRLGSEFVPRLQEMAIVANTVRLAGVSLTESVRYGTQIEQKLLSSFPDEIKHIWTRTGTGEVTTDPMGMEVSDVFITLHPRGKWTRADSQPELVGKMAGALEAMPGMRTVFTQPIEMRVNAMIAGIRADVGIKLFGDDFDTLKDKAKQIQEVVQSIEGAVDITVEQVTGLPVLEVKIDREAIARYGVAAKEVLEVIEALGVMEVGTIAKGQRRFALAIRMDDRFRLDPVAIGNILITAPGGQRLPLSRLATLKLVDAPATITREWAKRRISIQANVRGRDVASFVKACQSALKAQVDLPEGYYVRFGGQFEHLKRARLRLMIVVPIALLLIFVLLYMSFGDAKDALLVFSAVPFATIGGVFALYLRNLPFTISAGVGMVALFGVAVLGQLVLVSRIRQLRLQGKSHLASIQIGAETRLRPVVMTALVAALGFIPMALNTGVGAEVQRPLATVVIGGIVTSLLATLVVMPALYAWLGDSSSRAQS